MAIIGSIFKDALDEFIKSDSTKVINDFFKKNPNAENEFLSLAIKPSSMNELIFNSLLSRKLSDESLDKLLDLIKERINNKDILFKYELKSSEFDLIKERLTNKAKDTLFKHELEGSNFNFDVNNSYMFITYLNCLSLYKPDLLIKRFNKVINEYLRTDYNEAYYTLGNLIDKIPKNNELTKIINENSNKIIDFILKDFDCYCLKYDKINLRNSKEGSFYLISELMHINAIPDNRYSEIFNYVLKYMKNFKSNREESWAWNELYNCALQIKDEFIPISEKEEFQEIYDDLGVLYDRPGGC